MSQARYNRGRLPVFTIVKLQPIRAKSVLRNLGILPAARQARTWWHLARDPKQRRQVRSDRLKFEKFQTDYGRIFAWHPRESEGKRGKVLIVSSGMPEIVVVELALIKAFEAAGYTPCVVLPYDRRLIRYYKLAGVDEFHFWDDYNWEDAGAWAEASVEDVNTSADLLALELDGIRVGKFVASTALRALRTGQLDLQQVAVRQHVTDYLAAAAQAAKAAKTIVEVVQPQLALSNGTGYSPKGEMFDACLAAGIEIITWNAAHKNNTLMLKRYSATNRDIHPSSLSDETWEEYRAMEWTAAHSQCFQKELFESYRSGEWYSEVGTQFGTRMVDGGDIYRRLGLDRAKKTAVLFAHIFWDGTFFWGEDLFDSYEEWFLETLRAACVNEKVNWIVKIHPGNIVKNRRDGVAGEPSEVVAIREHIGDLPSHVVMLEASTDISTYSLFQIMDYCLTVRGTVGIEAASFGVPVLTAGTGRYDHHGFTVDSDSRVEYLSKIVALHEQPPLSAHERELAERFGYGTFVTRPLPLESVSLEYGRDEKASIGVRVNLSTPDDWADSRDIQSLATWIRSGREDYLAPDFPGDTNSHLERVVAAP